MSRPKRLSATFVDKINKPGRYGDGRGGYGLSLLVKPRTHVGLSKTFSQRLRMNGRPFNLGLGLYPLVSLREARERAIAYARDVKAGIDPRVERKRQSKVPTFAEATESVITIHSQNWNQGSKTERLWRSMFRDYALPKIGSMAVSDITTSDVLAVLTPIWSEKHVTAKKVRQRISAVMDWAIAEGLRQDNPVAATVAVLPKNTAKTRHHRALPFAEVFDALERVRNSDAYPVTKLAIEFLTLTATRSGETRGALWTEIDLASATWTIPETRMKSGREHKIPLTRRAMDLLAVAKSYADNSGLIFPSVRGKQLSDNTLSKLFRDLDLPGTPHGLRSSFRDWAAECTDFPSEICEFALAHVEGSAAERAYRRTDYFEKRRRLMEAWAHCLGG